MALVVLGGLGGLEVVLSGFEWFWMVLGGFDMGLSGFELVSRGFDGF